MFSKLFGWLFSWAKKPNETDFNFYRPKDRFIYHYWDGQKDISADPLVLYKKVMECSHEIAIDSKVALSQSKDALKAHDSLLENIRKIFGVKRYEEGGLTETETDDLLNNFLLYADNVKKNSSPFATSLGTTEDSTPTSEENPPPTFNTSASGSTENGPTTNDPHPPPLEPASP